MNQKKNRHNKNSIIMIIKSNRKLNSTLKFLNINRDPYGHNSEYVHEKMKIADDELEQYLILEKLVEDNFVNLNFGYDPKTKEIVNQSNPFFIIKFNGIQFINKGGYPESITQYVKHFLKNNVAIIIAVISLLISFFSLIK